MSKLPIVTKLIIYLSRWPEGLHTRRIEAWIDSCRKEGGYTISELNNAFRELRDSGRVACVNKIWYLKDVPTAFIEAMHERRARKNR